VHRDIKPANMLLDSSGGNGEQDHVYLADFGLSKRSLSVTGLTSMGQFLGTPAYVAPEQVEGHAVDGRTDQYALACTAFEMLTGSPPFQRDDDLAIMWAQVSAPPPALSEQRPDLPPAVDGVLRRALAKSPADRYPSCLAFAAALRAALARPGQPPARPEPPAGPGSTMVSGSPGRLRDTPRHPPTQISHPGAAGTAGAGGAGGAPEAAAAFGASGPGDAGGAPVSDPGARVFPPTEDWKSPGRVEPPSPAVPPYQPSLTTPPSHQSPEYPQTQQSPQYPQTEESRKPAPRQPAYPAAGGPAGRGPSGPSGPADRGPGRAPRRKSLWWPRGAIAVGCVAVVGAAIGVFAALHGGGGKNEAASGAADNATQGAATPAAAALAPLTAPVCRTVVARAAAVAKARTESVAVGDQPFAVTTTADGKYTFVSRKDAIVVLASHGGLAPAVDHVISVPGVGHGAVLTHDGKYLITVVNSGAVVLDVAAAERGSSGAVLGTLSSSYGDGAFGVAISPDDQFAFVTLQNSAALAVFNLKTALSRGFGPSDVVGKIGLGQQPAGLGLSTDNRWLYAASDNTDATSHATNGMVTVIDLALAETNPAKAVKTTVPAGCAPVRVIASADGQTIWVTSRDSDALLGFSAAKMVSDPAHALEAQVDVGTAPIGETIANVNGQARILVADSNLNSTPGAVANVAVVDPAKALRRVPSLLGYVSTGKIPRQFTIQPGGKTALVTNTGSGQLQAIELGTLP
jgi:DNA-binding beta-propeller fold protein YncE